jgi:DNA repair exonuclease SbcCD ATPase subunit
MSKETTYAGMWGEWERWTTTLSEKDAKLEHLEVPRAQLESLTARGKELIQKQSEWTALKQDASKELRKLIVEGQRLATVLRFAVRQRYGIDSEQLAKFGLQPFRGRRRKVDEPPVAEKSQAG